MCLRCIRNKREGHLCARAGECKAGNYFYFFYCMSSVSSSTWTPFLLYILFATHPVLSKVIQWVHILFSLSRSRLLIILSSSLPCIALRSFLASVFGIHCYCSSLIFESAYSFSRRSFVTDDAGLVSSLCGLYVIPLPSSLFGSLCLYVCSNGSSRTSAGAAAAGRAAATITITAATTAAVAPYE